MNKGILVVLSTNREKILQELHNFKWFTLIKSKKDNEEMKEIFCQLDFHLPYQSAAKGYTNTDSRGQKWESVMWSGGCESPNCELFTVETFVAKLLSFCGISDLDEELLSKIQKVTEDHEKLIKMIDEKKKLIKKNYEKTIELLLDELIEKV
jgi:hypothetical protein